MRNKKLKPLEKQLAEEYGINMEQLREIVDSPADFTKQTIDALNLKEVTEEEFAELKTNFIYKYLGKLHTNFNIIKFKNKKK